MPKLTYTDGPLTEQRADLLLLPVFKGPEAGPGVREVSRALGADVVKILRANGVKGALGDTFAIPTLGRLSAPTLLLVGMGPKGEADPQVVRRAAGKVAKRLDDYGRVATSVPQASRGHWEEAAQAFVEGTLLGAYRFERYKKADEPSKLRQLILVGSGRWDARRTRAAIGRGETLSDAVAWARDLVNTPAKDATPEFLAREARRMAREIGLRVKIWTKAELERGGFGGILGVGSGSVNAPRLIELEYRNGSGPPIGLAGKGITFDSGGLSLKDAKQMEWMKADMGGAAAVLATMRAIAQLELKVGVIAAIPCAENLPSGSAIRPGDVLRHRGGKSSEVLNTDAEGRLVLADALAYLAEKEPAVLVDAATLTGAMMIALGRDLWGVMGTDDRLIDELIRAGSEVGEPGWRMPLWDGYREQIQSQIADVKNLGERFGGAITAGLFLSEFVGDVPWAHLDIAGTAYADKYGDYHGKGGTGSPVRTLVRWIEGRASAR